MWFGKRGLGRVGSLGRKREKSAIGTAVGEAQAEAWGRGPGGAGEWRIKNTLDGWMRQHQERYEGQVNVTLLDSGMSLEFF